MIIDYHADDRRVHNQQVDTPFERLVLAMAFDDLRREQAAHPGRVPCTYLDRIVLPLSTISSRHPGSDAEALLAGALMEIPDLTDFVGYVDGILHDYVGRFGFLAEGPRGSFSPTPNGHIIAGAPETPYRLSDYLQSTQPLAAPCRPLIGMMVPAGADLMLVPAREQPIRNP